MRHPKLPKKIYNRLIINLGNLFVQKCDEVKRISVKEDNLLSFYLYWLIIREFYLNLPCHVELNNNHTLNCDIKVYHDAN